MLIYFQARYCIIFVTAWSVASIHGSFYSSSLGFGLLDTDDAMQPTYARSVHAEGEAGRGEAEDATEYPGERALQVGGQCPRRWQARAALG